MEDNNKKNLNQWLVLGLLMLASLFSHKVLAHALEQSYVFLSIDDHAITGRVEMTIQDLNRALSLDLKTDSSVTLEDLVPYNARIKEYYQHHLAINFASGMQLQAIALVTLPLAQYISIPFEFNSLDKIPASLDFEYNVLFDVYSEHRGFVVIENDWRSGIFDDEGNIALVFSPDDTKRKLDLSTSTVLQGYIEMIKLGIHHILHGIDHILFLLALLLPCVVYRVDNKWQATQKFRPALIYVIKIVSVFTVAHTLTLSAATINIVSLPSRLVESVIAISIAIAALDVLYPIFKQRIWVIVFIFGLFHGFGFASVLGAYNIPDSYLTLSLLAFNVGVEIGQVAIVMVAFPLLYVIRTNWFYHQVILKYGAVSLIVVSLYWFIERGFLIDLPAGAIVNWLLSSV